MLFLRGFPDTVSSDFEKKAKRNLSTAKVYGVSFKILQSKYDTGVRVFKRDSICV